jgi:hypothetical protein
MGIFSRHLKASRPAETIKPPRIEFIGEQAGPVEDDLKVKFRLVFAELPDILSAYLARLSYGEPASYSVGLCIRSGVGVDHPLQKRLGQIFTDTFSRDQHLDILFIRDDQEEELKRVCRPFYEAV